MILTCDNCGGEFKRSPAHVFSGRRTFCRRSCFREFHTSEPSNTDEVLDFLVEYVLSHNGMAPTYREIIGHCDISSTSHVKYVLDQLADAGLVVLLGDGKARAIQVVGMRLTYTESEESEQGMTNIGRIINDPYCNGFFGRRYDLAGSEITSEGETWIVIRTANGTMASANFQQTEWERDECGHPLAERVVGYFDKQELIDDWCGLGGNF
jgi:hypothetical protein